MTNTVYKVVYVDDKHGCFSCYCAFSSDGVRYGTKSPCVLEYKIGQITKPKIKNSKIYAFASAERAFTFIKQMVYDSERSGYAVLLCETGDITPVKPCTLARSAWLIDSDVIKFWTGKISAELKGFVPEETVLCDWVKPIRKVQDHGDNIR